MPFHVTADSTDGVGVYAQKNFTLASDVWVRIKATFPATTIANTVSTTSNNPFLQIIGDLHGSDQIEMDFDGGTGVVVDHAFLFSTPQVPAADTQYTYDVHLTSHGGVTAADVSFYVNGVLVDSGTEFAQNGWNGILIGWPFGGTDLHVTFEDLRVGTTQGGSDIFADDFSSGSFATYDDLSTSAGSTFTFGGSAGGGGPTSDFEGVSIAFDDPLLEPDPTWTRIDNQVRVSRWEIHRGRDDERQKTGAAEATVFIHDPDGDLDPSNTGGPWFNKLDGRQLGIARWNPITGTWYSRFRGTIEEWGYDLSPTQRNNEIAIRAVGFMAYLAGAEMAPGAAGQAPPAISAGNIFYEDAEVDDRILGLFADAGFDTALTVVFSGNVVVQETVYDPGYSFLAGIQDAADAEFPGVANVYEDRFGRVVFHGRHARFDPDTVAADAGNDAWDFNRWKLGDQAACIADPDTAQIRPPLHSDRSLVEVINAALAYPLGVKDADIQGQLVTDPTSIAKYGVRSWSAPDLRVLRHKTNGNTGLDETLNVATYYVTNNANPLTRPRQITLRAIDPADDRATATWDAITRVDVSDVVHLTVTNPGGGGFDDDYYVEGITESSEPLGPFTPVEGEYDNATVTLDVSPAAWYNEDTFPGDS